MQNFLKKQVTKKDFNKQDTMEESKGGDVQSKKEALK